MRHESKRPHGRLFTQYELRIEALPNDADATARLADLLDALDIEESLAAVARRIEEAMPDVRVEVRA